MKHEEWCDRGCDCGVGGELEDALRVENNTLRAERDRLQLILDSRPAINTGLLEAYIEWTQGVYLADMGNAVGHN